MTLSTTTTFPKPLLNAFVVPFKTSNERAATTSACLDIRLALSRAKMVERSQYESSHK